MVGELMEACRAAETDHRCRVILLRAEGPAFCAGMDLSALQMMSSQSDKVNLEDSRRLAAVFERLWSFPKPTVAAVQGAALGGGCAFGCDLRCHPDDARRDAWFPGKAHRVRPRNREHFPRAAHRSRPRARLLLTGRRITGAEALRVGLVNEVVSARCPRPARARGRGGIGGEQPAGNGSHEVPANQPSPRTSWSGRASPTRKPGRPTTAGKACDHSSRNARPPGRHQARAVCVSP